MDWEYNHTILKMMANLNRVILVTLEDSRLDHDLEEKMLKEHEEWEEDKRDTEPPRSMMVLSLRSEATSLL